MLHTGNLAWTLRRAVVALSLLGTATLAGCGQSTTCERTCDGRNCGDDGCGGTCGACAAGHTCGIDGVCVGGCTRNCTGRKCGDDGCGSSCGTCDTGFLCKSGDCDIDPAGFWVIKALGGTVSEKDSAGEAWDLLGGLPDPKVCLTISGQRTCTPAKLDTLKPYWGFSFPKATATALQGGYSVEYIDEDDVSDDPICNGKLSVSAADFASGSLDLTCTGGLGTISFSLSPQ